MVAFLSASEDNSQPVKLLATVLLFCAFAGGQMYAPLHPKITGAKKIYIDNQTGNPSAADYAYSQLQSWKRFEVVDSVEKADIVMRLDVLLTDPIPPRSSDINITVNNSRQPYTVQPVKIPDFMAGRQYAYIKLSLVDRNTSEDLWSVTQPASTKQGPKGEKSSGTTKCIAEFRKRLDSQEKK